MKKTFYTLFPTSRPQTLLKDPGMIPVYMQYLGYDVSCITSVDTKEVFSNDDYSILRKLQYITIKDTRKDTNIAYNGTNNYALRYIWQHAKEIDILNLYFKGAKLILIPDGIDDELLKKNHIQVSSWQNRKNIFLTWQDETFPSESYWRLS